jgi:transcriptional regulator with XRE-family HTH domain
MKERRELLLPIGKALRQAREKAGMTQETLAFEAEFDRSYISYLENDVQSPTVDSLAKICRVLGIATSDLIRKAEKHR